VFLSHLHADHISDIYTIRYAVFTAHKEGRMRKPLPLYMPRHPGRTFRFVRGVTRREFRLESLREKLALDLEGLEVRFLRTSHPIEAYAMRFTAPGEPAKPGGSGDSTPGGSARRSLVYTADTGLFPGLVRFCEGARVLVAEATLQNADRELERLGHMTAGRAGELARSSGAGTLVLTHIWPEYDKALSLAEAKRAFDGPVQLAERGMSLSV
jgi:ribonuclease BN (tRNA processing enzyme)